MKATLDGIDLSDVTAPQTEPLLNFLPVMGMSRVEVLRGSSGPLYGANAVSGVVNAKFLMLDNKQKVARWDCFVFGKMAIWTGIQNFKHPMKHRFLVFMYPG